MGKHNPEYQREWRQRNPEKWAAIQRRYRKKHPKMARQIAVKYKYGVTPAQYDALLETQGGVCAICNKPEKTMNKGSVCRLSVDHSHETNQIRGLLCIRCNTLLGLAGDDVDILGRAIVYLSGDKRTEDKKNGVR